MGTLTSPFLSVAWLTGGLDSGGSRHFVVDSPLFLRLLWK